MNEEGWKWEDSLKEEPIVINVADIVGSVRINKTGLTITDLLDSFVNGSYDFFEKKELQRVSEKENKYVDLPF
jgi:hypothetical protein